MERNFCQILVWYSLVGICIPTNYYFINQLIIYFILPYKKVLSKNNICNIVGSILYRNGNSMCVLYEFAKEEIEKEYQNLNIATNKQIMYLRARADLSVSSISLILNYTKAHSGIKVNMTFAYVQ